MILKKKPKKEIEVDLLKKIMEMLEKIQVNIIFCKAFKQMHIYAKFMKELFSGKRDLKHDENITLA